MKLSALICDFYMETKSSTSCLINLDQVKFVINYMKLNKDLAKDLFGNDKERLEAWSLLAFHLNTMKARGQEDLTVAQLQQAWKDELKDMQADHLSSEGVMLDEKELEILEIHELRAPVKMRANAANWDQLADGTSKKRRGDDGEAVGPVEGPDEDQEVGTRSIVRYLDHILRTLLENGRVEEHRYRHTRDLHEGILLLRGSIDRLSTQIEQLSATIAEMVANNMPLVE